MRRLMNLIAAKRAPFEALVTHSFSLDQIEEAYDLGVLLGAALVLLLGVAVTRPGDVLLESRVDALEPCNARLPAPASVGTLAARTSLGGSKMACNVGTIDRVIRAWIGISIIALVFVGPKSPLGLIGLVPLVTSIWGFCPAYKLLGFDTCRSAAHRGV